MFLQCTIKYAYIPNMYTIEHEMLPTRNFKPYYLLVGHIKHCLHAV